MGEKLDLTGKDFLVQAKATLAHPAQTLFLSC